MTAHTESYRLPRRALRVLRSPFLRNIGLLASGTALAQVLTVLAYPVLMRLYSPAEFGLFALFGAINLTFVVIATGRYELAIVLARTEEEAANVLALSLGIVLAVSAASGIVVWGLADWLLGILGYQELGGLLWSLPLMILSTTSVQVLSVWALRGKEYKRLSIATISRSLGVVAAQMAAGAAGLGADGLVLGLIAGTVVAAVVVAWQIVRYDLASLLEHVSWSSVCRVAREHLDFPLYSAPQALVSSMTITVPSVLLTAFFSAHIAGLYWFTYRLLEMPMSMVGDAVRRVFYQQAAELHQNGQDLSRVFWRTTAGLASLVLLPIIVTVAAGPDIFEMAFGEAWRDAGGFAQWVVLWWGARFISLPASMLIPVLGAQKQLLILEIGALLPRLLIIPVAGSLWGVDAAIAAYSAVGILFHLALLVMVWRKI